MARPHEVRRASVLLVFFLLASYLALTELGFSSPALASNFCNQTITSSVTLTASMDCTGTWGPTLGADGITLNCAGFSIVGGGHGISIQNANGVTVENCKVSGGQIGFYISGPANQATFLKDVAVNASFAGFYCTGAGPGTWSGNTAIGNQWGFYFSSCASSPQQSSSFSLTSNSAQANSNGGFYIDTSYYSHLTANGAKANGGIGFTLTGSEFASWSSNTANNNGGDGFYVAQTGSGFNTLSGNIAFNNGGNGFRIDSNPAETTMASNSANNNGMYGFFDGTTGSGTSGTAGTYSSDTCSGNHAGGSKPIGLCTGPPIVPPVVSVSPVILDSGQSAALTTSSPFGGGTAPFTCQWFREQPGSDGYVNLGTPFPCRAGDMPTLSTGTLSIIGTWYFQLSVTDSGSPPVTSASNSVQVSINAWSRTSVVCAKNSIVVGLSVACKAIVSGTSPTGRVAWSSDTAGIFSVTSCRLHRGSCAIRFTPTSVISQKANVTASYSGDAQNPASSDTFQYNTVRRPTKLTVTCIPTKIPNETSSSAKCTVTVAGYKAGGNVTWSQVGGTGKVSFISSSCVLVKARCQIILKGISAGFAVVQAAYAGDTNNLGSSKATVITVT